MTATHSLPLLMRPAGFLLPALAALALASCAAPPPPPSPPPTASVPPPAPQQQAPPPSPPPPRAAPAAQSQAPFLSPEEMALLRSGRSTGKPGSAVKPGKPGSTVEQAADQFESFGNSMKVPLDQQDAFTQLARDMGFEVRDTGRGYFEIGRTLKGGRVSTSDSPDR